MIKKGVSVCELLGVSQYKLAEILGVSRSAVSMFSAGKRSLPLAATIVLAEMLNHMKLKKSLNNTKLKAATNKAFHECITSLLSENEYQYLSLLKLVDKETIKQESEARLVHLQNFLQQRSTTTTALKNNHSIVINSKSSHPNVSSDLKLFKLTTSKLLLEQEKVVLESILDELNDGNEVL